MRIEVGLQSAKDRSDPQAVIALPSARSYVTDSYSDRLISSGLPIICPMAQEWGQS
jgi:hypothetical protein